jgi:chorismate mutase
MTRFLIDKRQHNRLEGCRLSTWEPLEATSGTGGAPEMDQFDALVALVVQRLALAEDVAVAKFASGQPVDDPIREREILESVARRLIRPCVFQEGGMQFFHDQIDANKVIQRGLHEHWRHHPEELPAVRHDLAAEVRPRLDHITGQMLWLFVRVDTLPRLPRYHVEELLARNLGARSSHCRLNQLRWDAATVALRSFVRRS